MYGVMYVVLKRLKVRLGCSLNALLVAPRKDINGCFLWSRVRGIGHKVGEHFLHGVEQSEQLGSPGLREYYCGGSFWRSHMNSSYEVFHARRGNRSRDSHYDSICP